MNDSYLTVNQKNRSIYKEKGSKFIAIAFPVASEEEVKNILLELRKEFYDARHHCYAYCLGKNGEQYRTNDDGEPNHSAGDPILGQIRSKGLTNILIVVVRYFGGTKLGVGGLIIAYKTVAKEVLDTAKLVEKYWKNQLNLELSFDEYTQLMSLVKTYHADIISQNFLEEKVILILEVREKYISYFKR